MEYAKSLLFALFSLIFVVLASEIAYADGCVVTAEITPVSENQIHLPSQKAAIAWDGETETMIISTRINSESLADLAWITPIISGTKPEVEEENMDIFESMRYIFSEIEVGWGKPFFNRGEALLGLTVFSISILCLIFGLFRRKNRLFFLLCIFLSILIFLVFLGHFTSMFTMGSGGSEFAEVTPLEILDSRQVGIYDVLVLKSSNSSFMLDWLNEQGYMVSQKAEGVLQYYCDLEDTYFIVNRIDVENMDRELQLQTKEALSKGITTPLKISFNPEKPFYPMYMSSVNDGNVTIDVYFFSNNPVRDSSGFLKLKGARYISDVLYWLNHSEQSEYIDLVNLSDPYGNCTEVFWFQYAGDLSNLDKDSYFIYDSLACEDLSQLEVFPIDLKPEFCYHDLALSEGNATLCESATKIDKCLYDLAVKLQDPSICKNISTARSRRGFDEDCYKSIIVDLQDISLCEDFPDDLYKVYCYKYHAVATSNVSLCEKLIYLNDSDYGLQVLLEGCYLAAAIGARDISLCGEPNSSGGVADCRANYIQHVAGEVQTFSSCKDYYDKYVLNKIYQTNPGAEYDDYFYDYCATFLNDASLCENISSESRRMRCLWAIRMDQE